MEQRTVRITSALRRRGARWALVLGAGVVGCSSAALLFSSEPAPRSLPPAQVTSTASGATAPEAVKAPVALEQFTPLLAEPHFANVAAALEAEEPARAAQALRGILEAEPSLTSPIVQLWAGRLAEQAGELPRAFEACERASSVKWLLADYAELCAARALLGTGRVRDALDRLKDQRFAEPLEGDRRLLVARAARASGDRPLALTSFRAALNAKLKRLEQARTRLELAEYLLEGAVRGSGAAVEPLDLVRQAAGALAGSKSDRKRAEDLEQRALGLLSAEEYRNHAEPTPAQRLSRLSGLVDARDHALADRAATELIAALPKERKYGDEGCEALLLRGKALAGLREFGSAVDMLAEAREHCSAHPDRGARIWYLSGRYASSSRRYVQTTQLFAELEKRFPEHSLADDARFWAAMAQQELGVESRFTELLMSLPEDYPGGDMAAEGLFRLALRRMERGAWGEAIGLLERGIRHIGDGDAMRGLDLSGRERYFRARALLHLGERDSAVSELESVIAAHPLSYYMVHAYSLLERLEPARGEAAVEASAERAAAEPFQVMPRGELNQPGFLRMMELLRIGELDAAVRELDVLGLRGDGTGSEILWGIALLYERAGFSRFSADLAKRRLNDVVSRWPVGGWQRAWQIAFPRPHLAIVTRESKATDVDSALIYAIMREESAFDPEAVSTANAYGLMQLLVPTARMLAKSANLPATAESLKRPRVNVAFGSRMLSQLTANFQQNPLLAIPAYNAGPGRARRWIRERPSHEFDLWVELIPYAETRRYTKRVLSSRAVYAFLYERPRAASRMLLPHLASTAADPAL